MADAKDTPVDFKKAMEDRLAEVNTELDSKFGELQAEKKMLEGALRALDPNRPTGSAGSAPKVEAKILEWFEAQEDGTVGQYADIQKAVGAAKGSMGAAFNGLMAKGLVERVEPGKYRRLPDPAPEGDAATK